MPSSGRLFGRRTPVSPPPGTRHGPIEQLDLVDLTLISQVNGSRHEVPGLGLRFDAGGVLVRGPDGSDVVQIAWASLKRLRTRALIERSGASRVELELESDRRKHRFVVPNVDPDVLRSSLLTASSRYGRPQMVDRVGRKTVRHF
jgi:hypothetical protein